MLLIRNVENMKAVDKVEKKQWIREIFRRNYKQHLGTEGRKELGELRFLAWPLVLALASHMSLISPALFHMQEALRKACGLVE